MIMNKTFAFHSRTPAGIRMRPYSSWMKSRVSPSRAGMRMTLKRVYSSWINSKVSPVRDPRAALNILQQSPNQSQMKTVLLISSLHKIAPLKKVLRKHFLVS